MLKHKAGSEKHATDALSQRLTLLSMSQVEVVGFEKIKEEYSDCPDFGIIYANLSNNTGKHEEYILQEGYLFKGTKLCVPRTSRRDFLI